MRKQNTDQSTYSKPTSDQSTCSSHNAAADPPSPFRGSVPVSRRGAIGDGVHSLEQLQYLEALEDISSRTKATAGFLIARDVNNLRDYSAETKLERVACWANESFMAPADFTKLPYGLQATFQWFFKHVKLHREALSVVAKTLKPWEEIVQQRECGEQPDASVGMRSSLQAQTPPNLTLPGDRAQDAVLMDSVCFGTLSLNWMAQTAGTIKEYDQRLSQLEENVLVTRSRLDHIVTDALQRSSERPQQSKHEAGFDLLCEAPAPGERPPDSEAIHPANTGESRRAVTAPKDIEKGMALAALQRFHPCPQLATRPPAVAKNSKTDRPTRRRSNAEDQIPESAGAGAGIQARAAVQAGIDFSVVNLVSRHEYNELQDRVASLTELLPAIKSDVEKEVQSLHRRANDLERLTTTHFSEIRESARFVAANVATCDMLMFEKPIEQTDLQADRSSKLHEGDDARASQQIDNLSSRVDELERIAMSMPQDIRDLQIAISGQQPLLHTSSSDFERFEALRSEVCDAAREHAEKVAMRAEFAVAGLEQRLAHITDVQSPSQAQERAWATGALHERAGVHTWSCSTRWPRPPSSLADGHRRSATPERIADAAFLLQSSQPEPRPASRPASRPGSAPRSRPGSRPASANSRHSRAPPTVMSSRTARLAKAGATFGPDVGPPPRLKSSPLDAPQSTADGKLEGFDRTTAQTKKDEVTNASGGGAPRQQRVHDMLNPGAVEGRVATGKVRISP